MRTVLCGPVAVVDQQSGPADEDGGLHGRVAECHERLPVVAVKEGQLLISHGAANGQSIVCMAIFQRGIWLHSTGQELSRHV